MNLVRNSISVVAVFVALALTHTTVYADELLVSAATSLADVLKEISRGYKAEAKQTVRFNFGPSSGLARQIREGAPADIFFSADLAQMDGLERNGLLEPGTRKNLLSNQLVMIVPVTSKLPITSPKDLLKPEVRRIALAEPTSVPVGVYTREYLQSRDLWNKLRKKVVLVQDARATLVAVESGNVEAGFVYKTDAAISKKIKVTYEVPISRGPKIVYVVAIVKASKHTEAARVFTMYLQSQAAKAFKRHGFVVID